MRILLPTVKMSGKATVLLVAASLLSAQLAAQSISHDRSVQAWAEVSNGLGQIILKWKAEPNTSSFQISRKLEGGSSWSQIGTASGSSTQFSDNGVQVGVAYEYKIRRSSAAGTGYGYVNAGVNVPEDEYRGKLVLLVDNTFSGALSGQLTQLEQDLTGDGWNVIRHDVSRSGNVTSIRGLVQNAYNADPNNVKAVLIIGHVPVPYSGNLAPDGHGDHYGAWPVDAYYGEMNGNWTDNSVWSTGATDPRNHNVPGDGKFDQSTIPGTVELAVGRVDFANLPAFSQSEQQLLSNYLTKLHQWKHKQFTATTRAIVDDHFWSYGSAFAQNGWRNFGPLVHPNNVTAADYMTTLANQSHLWSYGCGGGWWDNANGIGHINDFAAQGRQTVFTILFGSYFADWDCTNNFLRAPLASGQTLTNFWAGYPNWFVHQMGLGAPIGTCHRLSQNNSNGHYAPANPQAGKVHMALMGDPTLRMHIVGPPSNLSANLSGNNVNLTWTASTDNVLGYHVYRYDQNNGQWVRRNGSAVSGTSFNDNVAGSNGTIQYMVRARKLENSYSGSYYNLSQGVFATATNNGPVTDCAGVVGGSAFFDDCGVCSGGTSGHAANTDKDCAGVCFGTAALDDCGTCAGGTTGVVPNSGMDCAGVCGGNSQVDCAGVCGGSAFIDNCGTCAGGTTGVTPDAGADCAGVCGGSAFIDNCGVCAGGTTGITPNAGVDCLGVCGGTAVIDACGVCNGNNDCLGGAQTVCVSVGSSPDGDVEESDNGNIYTNTGDLDLVRDGSSSQWRGDQTVGLRFTGVDIPQGAAIVRAYVQFTAAGTAQINPCTVDITANATDNAAPFSWGQNDVSNRPMTSSVSWAPVGWTPGAAGVEQRTTDLSNILQQIISRPGWQPNNALVLAITGSGRRSAYSVNQDPSKAAQLCIGFRPDSTVVMDCNGVLGGPALPGTPCDDGNGATVNDLLQADCSCAGQLNDCAGVPGGPALPGTPCDDGDANTVNDTWTNDCQCVGEGPDCLGVPGGPAVPGTACNDNDPSTGSDTWGVDCTCSGLPFDCLGVAGGSAHPGTPCDDGNAGTADDTWDANCNCTGLVVDCTGVPGGPALPGSPCDDGDSNTQDDTWDANCNCGGLVVDCEGILGGPALPGTPCDDGDPDTTADTWDAQCTCAGVLLDCLGVAGGTALPGNPCDDGDSTTGDDTWDSNCNCVGLLIDCNGMPGGSYLPGVACDDNDPNTGNDIVDQNCNCHGTPMDCQGVIGGDAWPGTPCDDGDANTGDDQWDYDCNCVGQLPDCLGVFGGDDLPGNPCDDGDPTTGADTWMSDCTCAGLLLDCAGVPGGTAVYDDCGVCDGNNDCIDVTLCFDLGTTSDPDVEEAQTGNIYADAGPVDLTLDSDPGNWRGEQSIGLRFENVFIPPGASIVTAHVQFTAASTQNVDPCSLTVALEAVDDAIAFGTGLNEVSNRNQTVQIPWNPPSWNVVDEAGADQRTPNLAMAIQEVIDRPGWQINNNMIVVISGTGGRSAWSSNDDPAKGALLCISYENSSSPVPDCLGVVGGTNLPGAPCDDGDPDTGDDQWNNNCTCEGLPIDCLGQAGGPAVAGAPCDDLDPDTGNDVWDGSCNCAGQPFDCVGVAGGDAAIDSCGVCAGGTSGLVFNADLDTDSIIDCFDNCPDIGNYFQSDNDQDGVGNACDNCPWVPNPDQIDSDGNGFGDACDFTTGIGESDRSELLHLHPNPSKGMVFIECDDDRATNIVLRNVLGEFIRSERISAQVDLSDLANGTYLLMVEDADGGVLAWDRVVKN